MTPPRSKRSPASKRPSASATSPRFEAEVLPGLEPWAADELSRLAVTPIAASERQEGEVPFRYRGTWQRLLELRTVVAVYRVQDFAVPRPKALLGQQHFDRLVSVIDEVRAPQDFTGFRVSAAGSDSRVFMRLREGLERATGLTHDAEAGELLLRVRPAAHGDGWQVLVRLTPRPLSARPWRVCNMPGGLNATVAAAMVTLAGVRPEDRYLNAMCGSGTLLIERRISASASHLAACDIDSKALSCARENLNASGFLPEVELFQADATRLDVPDASFDLIAADLPWGDQVGSHGANTELYPAFLREMARVVAPGGRVVLLTHELRLFERLLGEFPQWRVAKRAQVFHGGHYPNVYLLLREAS